MSISNTELLNTKKHFETLDGLRGVAALAVVVFHFMELAAPNLEDNFIARGYLAVDFFFCLSGFVIAYAYDTRIKEMSIWHFFKLRLIRLHPFVVIGTIIGLIVFALDPFSNLFHQYGFKNAVLMFFSGILLIPYPIIEERFFNLFHLNPPTWSLFWEYVANIVYVLILFRLKKYLLWVLLVIAAILLGYESFHYGSLTIGWSGDNFWGGAVRVFYSFVAGMLIYRSNWIIRNRLGFILISVLLAGAFLVPFTKSSAPLVDVLLVVFYFPFIVALGAGVLVSGTTKKVCDFSGALSYPLYMVHYPFIWLLMSYMEKHTIGKTQMWMFISVGTILFIALAYLLMTFVDTPIRRYLKHKVK